MSKKVILKTEFELADTEYEYFKNLYKTYSIEDALAFLSVVANNRNFKEIILDNNEKA